MQTLEGANNAARILLDAKNYWMDRATAAEAALTEARKRLTENLVYWERVQFHDRDQDRAEQCFEVIQEEAAAAAVLCRNAIAAACYPEQQPGKAE